jgi:crotonobetaine/carnitine-CoA ligase
VREFIDARCAARGDATFLLFRGTAWSYSDLARITDGAAASFARLGLKRGDRVAVMLPNGPEMVFTWLALAKIGVVTAPLHPQLTLDEVSRMLAFVEPAMFILDPALRAARAAHAPTGMRLVGDELKEILSCRDPLAFVEAPGPDDPADILLTSGTTGLPKGVVQPVRTYTLTGVGFAHWLGLTASDRLFTCLPLSHINARAYSVMGTLAAGASLALEERFSASRFWDQVASSGATEANAIGAMLHILLKAPPGPADRAHQVRLVYSAPALGEAAHLAFERRFGTRLVIGYGLTESTFGFIHPLDGERHLDSMGTVRRHPDPEHGNEARLVTDGRNAEEGDVGEIWLRNPATFSGYYKDEQATHEALTPEGWLRTGDLARREPGGWYVFVGRSKETIRRRGENIAPAEVEAALMIHPAVKEAAVVGVASPLGEEDVAAFVVLEAGGSASEDDLRAWCAARLAPFKVPAVWRFLDALPRTSTQRVAKHLLRPE